MPFWSGLSLARNVRTARLPTQQAPNPQPKGITEMTKKNTRKSAPATFHEVWVYTSTDSEAGNARGCTAVSVFGSRAEAVRCMENTIAEDVHDGIVDADYLEYDGFRDLPDTLPTTPVYWTAETPDGRFFHSVTKHYARGPLITTLRR